MIAFLLRLHNSTPTPFPILHTIAVISNPLFSIRKPHKIQDKRLETFLSDTTIGAKQLRQDPGHTLETSTPDTDHQHIFKMSKSFSTADVAAHKSPEEGMYIIVDDGVYDVTSMSSLPSLLYPSPPTSSSPSSSQTRC